MKRYFLIMLSIFLMASAGCVDNKKDGTVLLSGSETGIDGYDIPDVLDKPEILIKKSKRILDLYDGEKIIASFPIGLGFSPEGAKEKEGDGKTPEGVYYICARNGESRFYKSLGISYPNIDDARKALLKNLIDKKTYEKIEEAINGNKRPPWDTPLGGEIYIHGLGAKTDWTLGCIALENKDMDILWKLCPCGTKVTIQP